MTSPILRRRWCFPTKTVMNTLVAIGVVLASVAAITRVAIAQAACESVAPQPLTMEGAETYIYKSVNGADLRLHIFYPLDRAGSPARAAIIFFFGGGWAVGTVEQFVPQSRYLARRGMVAIVADYRVSCRHKSNPFESVADAGSAIRYVRAHATELGVDPTRIVASGGSAGGHIALSSAMFENPGEGENASISSKPNALVLFNPGIDLVSGPVHKTVEEIFGKDISGRIKQISPLQNIHENLPPTIILNGKSDTGTLYATADKFCSNARQLHNDCRLIGYDGAGHGFFNHQSFKPGVGHGNWYRPTLLEVDRFLTMTGYLRGPAPPEILGDQ